MADDWKVEIVVTAAEGYSAEQSIKISGLTKVQLTFIRCMLQADLELDPVEELGFEKKDGNLEGFRFSLASVIENLGY